MRLSIASLPALVRFPSSTRMVIPLGQVFQYRRWAYLIAPVLADVAPHDAPAWLNDEHRRSSVTIAQQIVYAVSLCHAMFRVSQHGVRGA